MKKFMLLIMLLLVSGLMLSCSQQYDQAAYDDGYSAGYKAAQNDALQIVKSMQGGDTESIISDAIKYEGISGYDNICEYYRENVEVMLEDNMDNSSN